MIELPDGVLPARAPDPLRAVTAVAAPGEGPGYWAGAPTAILQGDDVWLAYRLRRPIGAGRGYAVVVSRSRDGVNFDEVLVVKQDEVGTESLERPALVVTPEGRWRLYLSCATPGTLHWTLGVLEADDPASFDPSRLRVVLDGGPDVAYKDPVISFGRRGWEMWVCRHLVAEPTEADAMASCYATSTDGLAWDLHGIGLAARPGTWDARGARITSVLAGGGQLVAYYDGRASFAENWEERTGIAVGRADAFVASGNGPAAISPWGSGSLRYLSAVAPGCGGLRFYYELALADGSHDLRTEYIAPRPG